MIISSSSAAIAVNLPLVFTNKWILVYLECSDFVTAKGHRNHCNSVRGNCSIDIHLIRPSSLKSNKIDEKLKKFKSQNATNAFSIRRFNRSTMALHIASNELASDVSSIFSCDYCFSIDFFVCSLIDSIVFTVFVGDSGCDEIEFCMRQNTRHVTLSMRRDKNSAFMTRRSILLQIGCHRRRRRWRSFAAAGESCCLTTNQTWMHRLPWRVIYVLVTWRIVLSHFYCSEWLTWITFSRRFISSIFFWQFFSSSNEMEISFKIPKIRRDKKNKRQTTRTKIDRIEIRFNCRWVRNIDLAPFDVLCLCLSLRFACSYFVYACRT